MALRRRLQRVMGLGVCSDIYGYGGPAGGHGFRSFRVFKTQGSLYYGS